MYHVSYHKNHEWRDLFSLCTELCCCHNNFATQLLAVILIFIQLKSLRHEFVFHFFWVRLYICISLRTFEHKLTSTVKLNSQKRKIRHLKEFCGQTCWPKTIYLSSPVLLETQRFLQLNQEAAVIKKRSMEVRPNKTKRHLQDCSLKSLLLKALWHYGDNYYCNGWVTVTSEQKKKKMQRKK